MWRAPGRQAPRGDDRPAVPRPGLGSRRWPPAIRDVALLPDPVGEVVRGSTLPNGMELRQVRVPLGVVGIIYEGGPNVTADAARLTLKSGNAVLLRGSSSARCTSNTAIVDGPARRESATVGLPADAVQLVPGVDHDSVKELMRARGLVDVLIPRGGADLIKSVVEGSTVPVIETGVGNCHVYVDADADLDVAERDPAQCQDPPAVSVCNAAETLLVHAGRRRARSCPRAVARVECGRGDRARRRASSPAARWCCTSSRRPCGLGHRIPLARHRGSCGRLLWRPRSSTSTSHGSGHTEAIVTRSQQAAAAFVARP